ncbi:myb-like protein X [Macrobrachium rosenbergii]|uniref:myb-like protein X n=1 Tax=Macrobrachium rosenbergii TaxID=79674 RepID=UPI0034D5A1AB
MDRTRRHPLLWILMIGVCTKAACTHAWGSYTCDVKEEGFRKIRDICAEVSSEARSPFSAIEDKLDRVLEFVEEIKTAEDSWLHLSKKAGTVERDLSEHDETKPEDAKEMADEEEGVDRSDAESDRSHDRANGYRWQDRRDRANRYDRRNRRERTSDDDVSETVTDKDSASDGQDNSTTTALEEKKEEYDSSMETRRRPQKTDEKGPTKGECSSIVVDDHETIGMFYMMSYQHGHCTNRNPISEPIRYCLGYCATKTFIERESGLWSQGNDCKSCQPLNYETIRIPLTCDDGFVFEKKFSNVVDCKCRRCTPVEEN